MSYPKHTSPIPFEHMTHLLEDLFPIGNVLGYEDVRSGLLSENQRVNTSTGSFFLKRYRDRINTVIHEIKTAEIYFANAGIPIILATKDRFDREAFWCQGSWYSLYPFIASTSPTRADLNADLLTDIAETLARLHLTGEAFTDRPFQMIRFGNPRKLHMETVELRYLLGKKPLLHPQDEQILEQLSLKERVAKKLGSSVQTSLFDYQSLLHGDFQHFNLFTKDNRVTYVYDLERVALGPCAYELVRAMLFDCFEHVWGDEQFHCAGIYLRAYRAIRPISLQNLQKALMLYLYNMAHTTWLEASYVIYGSERPFHILENQRHRLEYLSTHDLSEFADAINEKSRE